MEFIGSQREFVSKETAAHKCAGDEEAAERLMQILEGQTVPVETGNLPTEPPAWYDPIKFQRGQEFSRRHFAGVSLAHFVSLLAALNAPQILKPLIYSKKSETVAKSFKRYIETLVHVTAWYYGDVWQANHPARRSIQVVRNLHSRAFSSSNDPLKRQHVDQASLAQCGQPFSEPTNMPSLRKDAETLSGCPYAGVRHPLSFASAQLPCEWNQAQQPYLYLNQFDMAETQFTFIAVLILYPEKFGAKYTGDEELEGFVHFWRCIGYLLGVQDCYNFCNDDNLVKAKNLCRHYLENMVKPTFKYASTEFEHMGRAVAYGASFYYPGANFEGLFAYYAHVVGLPMKHFVQQMTYGQWFYFLYLRLVFGVLCWIPGVLRCISALAQFSIGLVVSRSDTASWWPKQWSPPQVGGMDAFWSLTRAPDARF